MTDTVDTSSFRRTVDHELSKWEQSTIVWGAIFVVVIIGTIVLPAVIAAEGSLLESALSWVGPYVPVLAVIAAVCGAVELGLTPKERWNNYQADRRRARDFRDVLASQQDYTRVEFDQLRQKWQEIQEIHAGHIIGGSSEKRSPAASG